MQEILTFKHLVLDTWFYATTIAFTLLKYSVHGCHNCIQGNDVGTQYRSGIYFYTPEQEKTARESMEKQQGTWKRKIVTEILPAKKFYRAEEYHQQYLEKGGRFGFQQSTAKGCNDPIRCYG